MTAVPHEDGEMRDPTEAVEEALGINTPIKILSSIQWRLSHQVLFLTTVYRPITIPTSGRKIATQAVERPILG